jgi:hypothetical protein
MNGIHRMLRIRIFYRINSYTGLTGFTGCSGLRTIIVDLEKNAVRQSPQKSES